METASKRAGGKVIVAGGGGKVQAHLPVAIGEWKLGRVHVRHVLQQQPRFSIQIRTVSVIIIIAVVGIIIKGMGWKVKAPKPDASLLAFRKDHAGNGPGGAIGILLVEAATAAMLLLSTTTGSVFRLMFFLYCSYSRPLFLLLIIILDSHLFRFVIPPLVIVI